MADYISKNEVLNLIMHNDKVCHYADERYENVVYATACRISDVVANMPSADVQPVRHGRWIAENRDKRGYADCYTCSNCNNYTYMYTLMKDCEHEYCPNCGAKMDAEPDEPWQSE